MEQEPASVAPPEHGMVEQPVENVIPEPHSLKYLLCHNILLLLMKLNNLLHFVELVGKLGLLVNEWWKIRLLETANSMNTSC
jgi:hypothetical protein